LRRFHVLVAVLVAVLGVGCIGKDTVARDIFSKQRSCPEDRIVVAPLEEPVWTPKPPPEIEQDPERLAIYNRTQSVLAEERHAGTYYVATGCGHETVFQCRRAAKNIHRPVCWVIRL
jgi:hypothetical protein